MRQKKLALVSLVLVFCCTLILAACQNQVTVTYSYNGGIISSTVNKGDCATPPTYNVPDGYEIVWYDDINFKTKWDLTAPVTEDITLFGKLEAKPVQITFVKNGETVDTTSVPAADRIVYPAISGNTATIWYEDEAATKIWNCDQPAGNSRTLYGKDVALTTIAQALEIAETHVEEATTERYLIKGTVKAVSNASYGEMTITDGTNDLYVYGSYASDGVNRYSDLVKKPYKGDEVLLYCTLQNFQEKTKQAKSAWIIDFASVPDTSFNEADYTAMNLEYARFADAGTLVKVTGVVSQIIYAEGMKPCGFYLIDNTSSIYVYDSQLTPQVKVGNTVTLCAEKAYYVLESEKANAIKFGYLGCNQLQDAHLINNDNNTSAFDNSWMQEKTVKEIMETPVTQDVASLTYKTTALIRKVPGNGFTNYYVNDIDGITGSYVYTMCRGSDFNWLDEFDGKICTVYLSPLNAKSNPSGCLWRFIPIAVKYENYTFDKADAAEFAIKYYAADQFQSQYKYCDLTDLTIDLTTSVSSDLLGISDVKIQYSSSNPAVMSIDTQGSAVKATLCGTGETTITMRATYAGYKTYEQTKKITVTEAQLYPNAFNVSQAISAALQEQVTVSGIVGPSLVNRDGFYLIDETGAIAVTTTGDVLATVKVGNHVVLKGVRSQFNSGSDKSQFGQSCVLDCELLANYYGEKEYATDSFVSGQTLESLKALDTKEDHTTTVYVLENAKFVREETAFYTKMILAVGETTIDLYCSSANQYRWLNDYISSGKTFKVELALCNWNGKAYFTGCLLAVYNEDGTKTCNTLNFQQ